MEIGKNIRKRRLAKGWQQDELARRVGSTVKTVGRWEREESVPNAGNIISLKRALGFTEDEIQAAFGLKRNKGKYRTLSLASAKALYGSYTELNEKLLQIEDEFPVSTVPGEYGADEKWAELLELCADSGGVVALEDNEIVGFWQCLPVFDEVFEEILLGRNVNKNITSKDIRILMQPGRYSLYFLSLFILDDHRNHSTRVLMLRDFFDFLRNTAAEGIFFERIAANITGIEARQICDNLHFKKAVDHSIHKYSDHVGIGVPAEIFQMIMARNGIRFLSLDRDLQKAYAKAGLFKA